jgi:hypothetical protein
MSHLFFFCNGCANFSFRFLILFSARKIQSFTHHNSPHKVASFSACLGVWLPRWRLNNHYEGSQQRCDKQSLRLNVRHLPCFSHCSRGSRMVKYCCVAGCSNNIYICHFIWNQIYHSKQEINVLRKRTKQNTRGCKPNIYIMGLLRQNIT